MKFFRKTPSADAILVQELQLALVSAQETNLTLQHQLKREIEAKTAIEMALYEADHRLKTLRESLDLSNKTLSVSRAEVRALKDQNHGLRQENQTISVLQEEMVTQTENFKMEMEAMKSRYGQVIVENEHFQKKIEELEGQLQKETEAKTSVEMALYEADHRLKTLQDSLDLSNKALSASRAEVGELQDQNNGLHQENQTISALQEEIATQKENYKMVMEAMKSNYRKVKELEGHRDQQDSLIAKVKQDSQICQEKLQLKIKELTEERQKNNELQEMLKQHENLQLDHSAETQEVQKMEETIASLQQEKQSLKVDCEAMKMSFQDEKKFTKGETIEFKVKAYEIIKHLESSLTKQKDISTKYLQELLKNSDAVTEQSQRNQTLEKELVEVREEQEKTSKKHEEERSVLNEKVTELYQNLEESVKVICDLMETKENLILQRNEQLKWIGELEDTIKQLREELRLKNEPQETQGKQSKDTWKTSGRKWRR